MTVKAREKNKYDAANLAWKTWRQWALQVWPRPPKPSEIDIWNLATRMADWPPGSILSDDPTTMTIFDWTWALRSARGNNQYSDQAREWFVPFAFVQLGIQNKLRRLFSFSGTRQSFPIHVRLPYPINPQSLPEEFHGFINRIPQA